MAAKNLGPIRATLTLSSKGFLASLTTAQKKAKAFAKNTRRAFSGIDRVFDRVVRAARRVSDGFNRIGRRIASVGKAMLVLRGSIAIAVGSFGALRLIDRAKEVARLDQSFKNLILSIGLTANEALPRFRRASRGTIDDLGLMQSANTAIILGVAKTGEQMERLIVAARRLGKATGRTATEGFNDLAVGIGRQSKLILDNLGLMVSVKKANEAYAKANKIVGRELTNVEQKAAFAEETLRQVDNTLALLGEDTIGFEDSLGRLSSAASNLFSRIARALIPDLTRFIESINSLESTGFVDIIVIAVRSIFRTITNIVRELSNTKGLGRIIAVTIRTIVIGLNAMVGIVEKIARSLIRLFDPQKRQGVINGFISGLKSVAEIFGLFLAKAMTFAVDVFIRSLQIALPAIAKAFKDVPILGEPLQQAAGASAVALGAFSVALRQVNESIEKGGGVVAVAADRFVKFADSIGLNTSEIENLVRAFEEIDDAGFSTTGKEIRDALTDRQVSAAVETVEAAIKKSVDELRKAPAALKNIELAINIVAAALRTGLLEGTEDLAKKIDAVKGKIKDASVPLPKAATVDATEAGQTFQFEVQAASRLFIDGIAESRDVLLEVADVFVNSLKNSLAKTIENLLERAAALIPGKIGGALSAAVFTALQVAALLFRRSKTSVTTASTDAITASTSEVRGVVAGQTNIPIAEIGETIANANAAIESILKDILQTLRSIESGGGLRVLGVGAAGGNP